MRSWRASSNSTQSAAKSEVDSAPKQAQSVNRQHAAAPAVAGRVNGPPPGASMAQGTNPMPPQARSQNQSAIVDAASAEAAPTAAAAPVPPAAAKARANGDSYRVDSNAAGGESALAVTTLPESAAQCIAAVQSLLGRERPAEARLLYRRCSERFTSIDWPAAMRQRFVEPATAPR